MILFDMNCFDCLHSFPEMTSRIREDYKRFAQVPEAGAPARNGHHSADDVSMRQERKDANLQTMLCGGSDG